MIILRKPGKRLTSVVIADPLGGAKNDSNQVFTTTYTYKNDSISVLYNGQALHSPEDFLQTGDNVVTLTHVYPGDTDVLRANYELDDTVPIGHDHGTLSGLLDDDHTQYLTTVRADARYYTQGQVDTISGTLQAQIYTKADIIHYHRFTDSLTDTPATYSGASSKVVRVKSDETGLEFVDLGIGVQKNGIQAINNGASTVSVTFASAFSTSNYTLTLGLENTVDSSPSVYPMMITTTTASGFTVLFSGDIDTQNYKLNWFCKE